MITVEEAFEIVLTNCPQAKIESINIDDSQGRVLAEDVFADRDFPPFDRVTMDGIAIQYDAFEEGLRNFEIEAIAPAGATQVTMKNPTSCVEVMTGAMLPVNCDTVIRYEDVELAGRQATINLEKLVFKQNIHFQGLDRQVGDQLIKGGKRIQSAELGVLATAGKSLVKVYKNPKVAIISSGDELVNVEEIPEPYQIRKSNNYSIRGALKNFHCQVDYFHLLDDPKAIRKEVGVILETYDVIILSGGVSKGKFDYIPDALSDLGVKKHFHKVKQRPGKPFWFGMSKENKPVFALPGNPVSSFMCTNKYVVSWMNQHLAIAPLSAFAVLASDIKFKPDLNYFAQVKLVSDPSGKILAYPIEGNGSGDLANLSDADAFLELVKGKDLYKKGEVHPIINYRNYL